MSTTVRMIFIGINKENEKYEIKRNNGNGLAIIVILCYIAMGSHFQRNNTVDGMHPVLLIFLAILLLCIVS